MSNNHRQLRMIRLAAMFFAVWFIMLSAGVPREASAILLVAETNPMWLREHAEKTAASLMKDSALFNIQLAFVSMLSRFTEQIAYDTAVWVATADRGQFPLFNPEDNDSFWKNAAFGAGLQFLDDMDKNVIGPALSIEGGLGLASFVCSPDLRVTAMIKLAIAERLKPQPPLCTWRQFRDQWSKSGLAESLSGSGIGFEQGESDLSAALEIHNSVTDRLISKQNREFLTHTLNKGFKPYTDKISGLTRTPAAMVQDEISTSIEKDKWDTPQQARDVTSSTLNSFDYLGPMLAQAGQALAINFGITLASQLIQQRLLKLGLFYNYNLPSPGNPNAAPSPNAREQAQAVYASFIAPKVTTASDYDPIAEFATCDPPHRQPTTCVIDTNFQDAIRRSLSGQAITVREAIDAKLLHDDWQLIPAGTADDLDPNCYQHAYCASNLAKLRLARVLPVGWEFAANHENNRDEPHKTLRDVIDGFGKTGTDGVCNNTSVGSGETQESPYCGLIDPNWVLKFPVTSCRTRGPGETLLDRNGSARVDVCTDYASCTETDANGRCIGGYGYCTREKNTWYVRGTTCPPEAASCRALTSRTGGELSVITTTTDNAQCNAENAGCLWYASKRNASGNWVDTTGDRRYFNRNIEQCTQADEGCTELLQESSTDLNLVADGGFEGDVVGTKPASWSEEDSHAGKLDASGHPMRLPSPLATAQVQDSNGIDGKYLRCSGDLFGNSLCSAALNTADIRANTTYTLSAAVRLSSPLQPGVTMYVGFQPAGGGTPIPCLIGVDAGGTQSQNWQTYRATCNSGDVISSPRIVAYDSLYGTATTTAIDIDQVILVVGTASSAFHEGYAPTAPKIYLRVATPGLNCDATITAQRHSSCGTFAKTCDQSDIGCEQYTATDSALSITGKYTDNDRCPAQCVGYSAFKEVESNYDKKDPLDYFIPSTARQCSAVDVGCSEFTNLDRLASGGEAREYYTFLRQCRKETDTDASPATYYTWEGSAMQGYQLRSFRLKASGDVSSSAPWTPSCGNDPSNCAADSCQAQYGKPVNDPAYNSEITPDCRAFYSQNGTINYRRLSQTVIITDDCVPYRLSQNLDFTICGAKGGTFANGACVFKGNRAESQQCSAQSVGCREYRGNAGGAVQSILSTSFTQQVNGNTLGDGWEGNYWQPASGGRTEGGVQITGESLVVGDHSLRITSFTDTAGATPTSNYAEARHKLQKTVTGLDQVACEQQVGIFNAASGAGPSSCLFPTIRAGKTYEVILTGKGTGLMSVGLRDTTISPQIYPFFGTGNTVFGPTWQRVVLGPLILPNEPSPSSNAYLKIAVESGTVFIDSITLREIPTTFAVIKGSWVTPRACDRATMDPNSAPQAQGMLGCREYRDRAGTPVTLRSFSKLCGNDVVGCTAFYDTRGNVEREQKPFNNPSPDPSDFDDVTVPADTIRYLVDAPEKRCQATAKTCRRVALPTLDRSAIPKGTVVIKDGKEVFTETFLKDDPAKYEGPGATLCTDDALFCEEYAGHDGSLFEFKDPGNRTCTFKGDPVDVGGGLQRVGWFQSASLVPSEPGANPAPVGCDPNYVIRGAEFGIRKSSDSAYNTQDGRRTGLCEPAQDFCTEFRDTTDQSPAYPDGKPYQVIKDASLDLATCAGTVSRKKGCALLNDTTRPDKMWSAAATYAESDLQRKEVSPINCDQTPEKCKRCGLQRVCRQADGTPQLTSTGTTIACLSDALCIKEDGFACRGSALKEVCSGQTQAASDTWCKGRPGANPHETCNTAQNDSNLIAKVQRDRMCSQWLDQDGCVSSVTADGKFVKTCTGLRLAVDQRDILDPMGTNEVFTRTQYQSRDTSWNGLEASGYAVPNLPPLQTLEQVIVHQCVKTGAVCNPVASTCGTGDACVPSGRRLSYVRCDPPTAGAPVVCGPKPGFCKNGAFELDACGSALPQFGGQRGICLSGRCAYGVVAPTHTRALDRINEWPAPRCRVLPEGDAPFSRMVFTDDRGGAAATRHPDFANANVCDSGSGDCSCAYQKLKYEAGARYRAVSGPGSDVSSRMCFGGANDGQACTPSSDSVNPTCPDGTCSLLTQRQILRGIEGYCIEEDPSLIRNGNADAHPCRTFLPVDQLSGSADVNAIMETAQLRLPTNQQWYCADALPARSKISISRRVDNRGDVGMLDMIPDVGGSPSDWLSGVDKPFRNASSVSNGSAQSIRDLPPSFAPLFELSSPVLQKANITTDHTRAISWINSDLEDNCQGISQKGWCVWPGTRENTRCHSEVDGAFDRGCQYIGNAQAAPAYRCVVNGKRTACQRGGFNFFGCYTINNSSLENIYFPWAGDFPIYDWQVEDVEVQLGNAEGLCRNINPETGNDNDSFNDDETKTNSIPILLIRNVNDGGVDFRGALVIGKDEPDGVAFHALFDKTTREFKGVAIEAFDTIDTLDFFVRGITFNLVNSCRAIARVSDGVRNYAFTDRTWVNAPEGHSSWNVQGHTTATQCVPFGGISWDVMAAGSSYPLVTKDPDPKPNTCAEHTAALIQESASPSLKDIFARVFSVRQLFLTADVYGNYILRTLYHTDPHDQTQANMDVRKDASNQIPPIVMGVKNCDQSGRKCEEAANNTVAVNGKVSGNVLGNGGLLKARIQFYYYADKDHMPVRRVMVDFGDGSTGYDTSNNDSAPYPNRRGFGANGVSLCNNSNFGQSKDACIDRPFTIEHTYQCVRNGNGWVQSENRGDGACVFYPRVYVEDNWGYCTGPATPGGCGNSSSPGGEKCFDGSDLPTPRGNECEPDTSSAPWVNFGGKVIVLPP